MGYDEDKICVASNGDEYSLWGHVSQFYQPHALESDLMGLGNVQKPKVECAKKGKTEWCYMYCGSKTGSVKKSGRGWKCHSKKGWLPGSFNGNISSFLKMMTSSMQGSGRFHFRFGICLMTSSIV